MADNEITNNDDEYSEMEEETEDDEKTKVYLPTYGIGEDEEMIHDESAYVMYHHATTGAPCLSFSLIDDGFVSKSKDYPISMNMVAGSQSSTNNHLISMKMSNLRKTLKEKDDEDSEDSSSDEEEDEDMKPILDCALRQHKGGVNRIRYTQIDGKPLAASWSEHGSVNIWDLDNQLKALKNSSSLNAYKQNKQMRCAPPVFCFSGYMTEGFAMDWSSNTQNKGYLLTGDCKNQIFLLKPKEESWSVDQTPFSGHTGSVEDIQWYPNEANVFASCSVDTSIRIWDIRTKKHQKIITKAHDSDINVMSWNDKDTFIATGGDDGMIKIWDIRQFSLSSGPQAIATFKHHTAPITSIEWNPNDRSVFAASGADDQLTIWDLAVEKDDTANDIEDVPPQLLFIHQGQHDIKELHWHKQYPGVIVSTALDGFNVFKTISV